jgi:hypothetical protein
MSALRWVAIALALVAAGFMIFDGTRALLVGDYLRPASGGYAGELGPWANIVEQLGIDPLSTGMKSFFVVYGAVWLIAIVWYVLNPAQGSWTAMLALTLASLWYLVIGTMVSILVAAILLIPSVRRHAISGR